MIHENREPVPVNPSAEAKDGQSLRRPSDVFSGAMVKRRFVAEVLAAIKQTATAHETFAEGNMLATRERDEWAIPAGKAVRTPSSWGHPSSLYVDGEEARAHIMLAMGIDLRNSHAYRKYC